MQTLDHSSKQRIMALTVLARIIEMVQDIARTGKVDEKRTSFLLHSLFVTPDDPSSIYADTDNMKQAMRHLLTFLRGENVEDIKRSMPHIMSLIGLEKKLSQQGEMLELISNGMTSVSKQKNYFGSLTHESVIGSIADLYGSTISSMSPRIMIKGKPEFLKVSYNTNSIRALLLVGIRAAYMWRTNGGTKWRMIFFRNRMARDIERLLA
ncbi:MAG: high frequency lysogenization protein HflD [Mariprofundaceae bacterium]|nr:high frequency lysogenization protein HflD [Mariprofundaceae bacterium]